MTRLLFLLLTITAGVCHSISIAAPGNQSQYLINEVNKLNDDTLKVQLLNKYFTENADLSFEEKKIILDKALEIAASAQWAKGLSISYTHTGLLYLGINACETALCYFDSACIASKDLREKYFTADALLQTGKALVFCNDTTSAQFYLEKSLNISIKNSYYNLMRDNYKALSNLMYKKKDFENAYFYLSSYEKLIDSLYIHELKTKIKNLQQARTEEEKENEIEQLTRENYYKEELLRRNVTLLYFSIGTLIFLIIFGYTAFVIYKSRKDNLQTMFEEEIRMAIYEKEKKFSDIVRLLPQIIFETNKTGYFTFVNKHCVNKSGYTEGELYLMHINDIIFSNTQKSLNAWSEKEFKELTEKEYFLRHKNNTFIPVILYLDTVYFDNEYFGTRGIVFDISDRKEIEERIIKAIISTEEKERSRFSKDLHDTLGPLLSTLKLYINELESEHFAPNEKGRLLSEINTMINDAIAYSREISHNITPLVLKDYGLWKSINMFVSKINSLNKIEIIFKNKNENIRYASFFEINIYRIVLELIQNSVKHANATNIVIDMSDNNNVFRINYYDNGKGFDFQHVIQKSDGMGLFNILSRIKTLKGIYNIQTSDNEGFTFVMTCSSDGQLLSDEKKSNI